MTRFLVLIVGPLQFHDSPNWTPGAQLRALGHKGWIAWNIDFDSFCWSKITNDNDSRLPALQGGADQHRLRPPIRSLGDRHALRKRLQKAHFFQQSLAFLKYAIDI
jgi:hypothetical protein